MNKEELRKIYQAKRDNEQNKIGKSQIIMDKIKETSIFKKAKVVALYSTIKSEVDPSTLFSYAKKLKKVVVYPRVIDKNNMVFIKVENESELIESLWHIKEPIYNKDRIVDKKDIDLMIVPGLCFDKNKNRLGYGRGFYDKYLLDSNIIKVGVTYDDCVTDSIKVDKNDIKMDYVITDKEIY